jgi:hypothetical protein
MGGSHHNLDLKSLIKLMTSRSNLLLKYLKQGSPKVTRRNALLKATKGPSRRDALMKRIGPIPYLITGYKNTKGRPFYVTLKGTYIIRVNGKSVYGRKANSCHVPAKIRPRKCKSNKA